MLCRQYNDNLLFPVLVYVDVLEWVLYSNKQHFVSFMATANSPHNIDRLESMKFMFAKRPF